MADKGERITRELTIRYMAVLAVLGGMAVASFLGLARVLMDAQSAAALVNVAGKQRMLVERVAFAASRLVSLPANSKDRPAVEKLLADTVEQVGTAHEGLTQGLPELKGHRPPSEGIRGLLYGPQGSVDHDLREFLVNSRALLENAGHPLAADDPTVVAVLAAADGRLLNGLDEVADRFQRESEERLLRLFAYHGAALVVVLALLLVSAFGVFRPMVERVRADISDRFRAEKDLRESEERLWRILEESPVGVSVSRRKDGKVVFANTRFVEILGMPRDEFIGSPARDHYVDSAQRQNVLAALRAKGRIDDAEVEFKKKDGSLFWALLTIRSARFEGEAVNLAWIYDITTRKAAEEQLRLAAKVLETANEAVVISNARNEILAVNPAFTAITEYEPGEVVGQNPSMLQSGRHDPEFYKTMWLELQRTGRWRGEIWNRRKSGEFFAEWLSIVALKGEDGKITHYIAVFSDITHRKEDEERVWRQANYDALTGLPNRSLFVDRLSQAVRQSKRDGKKFALMFIDLDGFKAVNDTLGHAAGDILLQQTAGRLSECMRASDTVARLAGDEFTIIMQGVNSREDVAMIAAKILDTLAQPFDLDGKPASVRGSIGIALFPDNADDGQSLLQLADEAMYAVKKTGKNNFEFVDDLETAHAG